MAAVTICKCPQSFPALGTFPMSWLFTSDDQNTGVSASESELPTSFQGWFPLRLTGWSPCSPRDSQESSPVQRHQLFALRLIYSPALTTICDHWEDHSLDYMDLCQQSNLSTFQILSRFVIAFLPRSNHLLISCLQWFWSPRKENLSLLPPFPLLFAMK